VQLGCGACRLSYPDLAGNLRLHGGTLMQNVVEFHAIVVIRFTFRTRIVKCDGDVSPAHCDRSHIRVSPITIDQAVFEPRHWIDLLGRYSLRSEYAKGTSVKSIGAAGN
jgi:hypothetical protein